MKDFRWKYLGPLPIQCGHRHLHRLVRRPRDTSLATSPIAAYPKHLNGIIAQVFTEEFRPVPAEGLSWRDDLLAPCIFHPDASTPWDEKWTYIGRGCSTRSLMRSRWANPFSVTAHVGMTGGKESCSRITSASPRLFCGICRSFRADFWCCHCRPGEACHGDAIVRVFKLFRDQQAPSFQIRSLEGFRAVQLLDLAMGVLAAAAGIKPVPGHLAAEGSVQLGISVGEDRRLVILDGRAPHLLKALNDTLRPPLAKLEFGVHWTSLQVNWGASSDWHTDQVVGRLATTVLGELELDGSGPIEVRDATAIFDPQQGHRIRKFQGSRVSIVAFRHPAAAGSDDGDLRELKSLGFPTEEEAEATRLPQSERPHSSAGGEGLPLDAPGRREWRYLHDGAGLCSPGRWLVERRRLAAVDRGGLG